MVADALVARWRMVDKWREKFEALQIKNFVADNPVLVMKPLTFMNLSGQAIQARRRSTRSSPPTSSS